MTSKFINKLIILLSFLIALFALLFCAFFTFIFVQHAYNVENSRLETKALALSDAFSKAAPDGYAIALYNGTVLNLINKLNQNEVWLIDKGTLQISGSAAYPGLTYAQLSAEEGDDIQKIFSGQNIRTDSFAPLINPEYTTIGVPIYDRYGQIQAALLLHDRLPTLKSSWYDGVPLIFLCALILYALCIALLIRLTKKYILSLTVINSFIQKIISRDYSSRIKTKAADEIGQMAQSVNQLSQYLQHMENSAEKKKQFNDNLIVKTTYKLHTPLKDLKADALRLAYQSKINAANKRTLDTIDKMLNEIDKIQRITNSLFDLSQIDSADFSVQKDLLNLLEVLKNSIDSRQKYAADKSITLNLNINLDKELILFSGDKNRLEQMFCEIINKAIDIYPPKSELQISAAENDAFYFIRIENKNDEVSAKRLPEFFQDARSDNSADPLYTSLELNIAKSIASMHGIKLSYRTEADEYAKFEFAVKK